MDIAFERVSLRYGETVVLEEVSFRVQSGQFALIEGPSGAGKSSMLRLINRLEDPSSGTISADGRPLPEWPVLQLRRQIAYVPQIPVLFPGTVRENLLTPFRFRANRDRTPPTDEELRARLSELLLEVKLEETATTLSVGQQQRIALLRAALLEPRLMLCDEPTAPAGPRLAGGRRTHPGTVESRTGDHRLSRDPSGLSAQSKPTPTVSPWARSPASRG